MILPDDISQVAPGNDGYEPRDWTAHPLGGTGFAAPFNLPEIPRNEWRDRIQHLKANKLRLLDLCEAKGVKPKHQGRTSTCWAYSVTMAQEVGRAADNQDHVPLSPASIAALITGYRDQGGWCSKALEAGAGTGWVPESLWPGTAVTARQYNTPQANAEREKYKATHWLDIDPRDSVSQIVACLLRERPIPVASAHMRIRHAWMIVDLDLDQRGNLIATAFNSGYLRNNVGITKFPLESWRGADEALCLAVGTGG